MQQAKRLVVGMTGATGAAIGVRLLGVLQDTGIEAHLVMSKWAVQTLEAETNTSLAEVRALAHAFYAPTEMGAAISSGSFPTDGMVVVPCSMRSAAAIATGLGDSLVHRAADVTLKEGRKLVLVPRETPLNQVHLENLLKLARMGVAIVPPMPAFYNRPQSVADIVDHIAARILDQLGIETDLTDRWSGMP